MDASRHVWFLPRTAAGSPAGQEIVAVGPRALEHAVDLLMGTMNAEKLSVRSGEHLAAILLTALVGRPAAVDSMGEVDLVFVRQEAWGWPFGATDQAAVEVKSLGGSWRKVEARLRLGDAHTTMFRTAMEILTDASDQLDRILAQLRKKTTVEGWSRNIFLVIHPFDALAVELFDETRDVAQLLPLVDLPTDVDTLWLLWHPDVLVWWSGETRSWTRFFIAAEPDAVPSNDEALPPLQVAERHYLDRLGRQEGSPWLFGLSSSD